MRLDFNTFVISGPSTSTLTVGLLRNGDLQQAGGGLAVSAGGQCHTDIFTSKSSASAIILVFDLSVSVLAWFLFG